MPLMSSNLHGACVLTCMKCHVYNVHVLHVIVAVCSLASFGLHCCLWKPHHIGSCLPACLECILRPTLHIHPLCGLLTGSVESLLPKVRKKGTSPVYLSAYEI